MKIKINFRNDFAPLPLNIPFVAMLLLGRRSHRSDQLVKIIALGGVANQRQCSYEWPVFNILFRTRTLPPFLWIFFAKCWQLLLLLMLLTNRLLLANLAQD